jgi:hypothetical protein
MPSGQINLQPAEPKLLVDVPSALPQDHRTHAEGFERVADSPARTSDRRPNQWVAVRPPGARPARCSRGPRRRPGRHRREASRRAGGFLSPCRGLRRRVRANGHRRAYSSSRHRAPSLTARSPCSSTSPATNGT